MAFTNCYNDVARADSYAKLEFANTYYLAYRDVPELIRKHVKGTAVVDFGCGTGRSTRFLRKCGLHAIGIDIAEKMIQKAREADPEGDYRLIRDGDFSQLPKHAHDLVLSMFTFDNIPGQKKIALFGGLGKLLKPDGRMISVVSAPEIYWHEWASFSTRDFPENRHKKSGDVVKIIVTDHPDRRPVDDIIWTDESYREVYTAAGLEVVEMCKPLAKGDEPYNWVSETTIAPWVIYVLKPSA